MSSRVTRTIGPEGVFGHETAAVWGVALGLGPEGDAVRRLALSTLEANIDRIRRAVVAADAGTTSRQALAAVLEDVMLEADKAINAARGPRSWTTAGMVIATLGGHRLHLATVGPCAAFLSRDGRMERLTRDRSDQALGTPLPFDTDIAEVDLHKHDAIVLCGDEANPGQGKLPDILAGGDADGCGPLIVIEPDVEAREELAHTARIVESMFLFADLSRQERLSIAPYLEYRIYEPGAVLMREGEPGDEFMAIAQGSVRISRGDTHLRTLVAGDHFGELALIGVGARSATATVDTPTWLLVMSRGSFEAILARRPEIGVKMSFALLKTMGTWLADLTARVSALDASAAVNTPGGLG